VSEKTCGTCPFWTGREALSEAGEAFRQCQRLVHDQNRDVDGYDREEEPAIARQTTLRRELAVLQDGSGYYAAIKCRADFGCVLHEPACEPLTQESTAWVVVTGLGGDEEGYRCETGG
jgi:hypothetical protein